MWHLPLIAAPGSEPITLVEAKAQARIDHNDEDGLIQGYIASARDYVEAYTGTLVGSRTVTLVADGFADLARLPIAPVGSVTDISYVDPAGAEQTVPATDYSLVGWLETSIVPKGPWPVLRSGERVSVEVVAGYAALPPAVRHSLLLLVSSFIAQREDGSAIARSTVDNLLANFRFYP